MNIVDFKRDDDGIRKLLNKKDGKVLVTREVDIYFPSRYAAINLAYIELNITYIGICMIVDPNTNTYMVVKLPSMLTTSPNEVKLTMLDGVEYYKLSVLKDNVIFNTTGLVKQGDIVYHITREFYIKGKIPIFLNFEDLSDIMDKTPEYTGSKLFDDPVKAEVFTSVIGRTKEDPKKLYRTLDDMKNLRWVGLGNKDFGYANNIARLSGAYLKAGIEAGLNDDTPEFSEFEEMLLY